MLQCTAVTEIPYAEALLALATMKGGPERPSDFVEQDDFVLCELGDHGDSAEHAAHLFVADTPDDQELWFRWSGDGAHRVHRLDVLPVCPALLRVLATGAVTPCAFFDHHPGPHSFSVTDPLGDLIADCAPGPPHSQGYPDDLDDLDAPDGDAP
ncbi:hypothetical protein ACFV2V_11925 [Streptomyces sp. NPDC059698]|uniref:hypothetical protein n=1 Tax=unclassified Streptomyces TaxID=2593676 RepID=UPI00093E3C5D|nr:hypothetical protein [Streptomyces sp. CB02366]OKJ40667.1 hypothetical protein AMK24_01890 [Streptomyces sp. CB02366]